ncbi:hypothetical protein ACGFX8_35920 [Streptomyces sp. NPDC048362]|uniref:hypothetical protein n=1 Tax=Streptomyces sp. NPDC048362 TaxID=3365539 RepID=UPI00371C9327
MTSGNAKIKRLWISPVFAAVVLAAISCSLNSPNSGLSGIAEKIKSWDLRAAQFLKFSRI